jgi:hypothetical protein
MAHRDRLADLPDNQRINAEIVGGPLGIDRLGHFRCHDFDARSQPGAVEEPLADNKGAPDMTTTLITGSNKGLGYETARQLVAAGALATGPQFPHRAAMPLTGRPRQR